MIKGRFGLISQPMKIVAFILSCYMQMLTTIPLWWIQWSAMIYLASANSRLTWRTSTFRRPMPPICHICTCCSIFYVGGKTGNFWIRKHWPASPNQSTNYIPIFSQSCLQIFSSLQIGCLILNWILNCISRFICMCDAAYIDHIIELNQSFLLNQDYQL